MNNIEDVLKSKKSEFDTLEVPAELEELLRAALNRKKIKISNGFIAAAAIVLILFSYSFDSLAFYGKKILGYDEITYGSIKKLTEEGWGQKIGKSCTFSNGMEVILDGIMFDDNELVAFYTLKSNGRKIDYASTFFKLTGIKPFGYNQRSGHGKIVDEFTQVWMQSFEPPAFYEKWVSLKVRLNEKGFSEEKEIRFTLDRNAAMKRTVKSTLNAQVRIDKYDIKFETISISGMSTLIEGKILPMTEDAANAFRSEDAVKGLEAPHLRFDIAADNDIIGSSYGGISVSNNEISFSSQSEALPEEFQTLELKNIRLESNKFADKTIDLSAAAKNLVVSEDLIIRNVEIDSDKTTVTVLSRGIPVMGLFIDNKQIKGENDNTYDYEAERDHPVERVFKFDGKGDNMKLSVKTIKYSRFSDEKVSISLE